MKVFSPSEALLPSNWPEQSLGHKVMMRTQLFWKRVFASVVPFSPKAALESRSKIQSFLPLPGCFHPSRLHPALWQPAPKSLFPLPGADMLGSGVRHHR